MSSSTIVGTRRSNATAALAAATSIAVTRVQRRRRPVLESRSQCPGREDAHHYVPRANSARCLTPMQHAAHHREVTEPR